jgi:hypothetical protein
MKNESRSERKNRINEKWVMIERKRGRERDRQTDRQTDRNKERMRERENRKLVISKTRQAHVADKWIDRIKRNATRKACQREREREREI